MASTSYSGGGQGQGPLGHGGDAQASGAGHQGGTAPGQQGVSVPDPLGSQGAELRAQGYGGGHHLPGQGGGLPDQGKGGHQDSGGGQPAPSLGQPQQVPPRQTGEQAWRAYREQRMLASQAPIVSSGVQVKTEQLQSQGQSSPASGQGQGQPTQSGQGQQGLGGYGPQLSDPYQGQPYGLSSQSTQQANPFAAGASSTPAPTTQYNSPYGARRTALRRLLHRVSRCRRLPSPRTEESLWPTCSVRGSASRTRSRSRLGKCRRYCPPLNNLSSPLGRVRLSRLHGHWRGRAKGEQL
ncbi:hypothetical protein PR002_g6930 [Phytophthora rubi]|uniref:Uncharacterized protein n=1 Tax=Phytophthora rubi TaxID=129364 RepID=A0A6A3N665_9STRA|nr:hypothetical protein PR002_g6930 [Phytophthora rubi]